MKLILFFPFLYFRDILVGSLRIARDVFAPRPDLRPVILRVPVTLTSPVKRFILANLISMTPGTVSVAEEKDGRVLVVHSLYGADDPDALIRDLQETYHRFLSQLP
jgi:multicomponent Na+:H+ antiporter subunit E